MGSPQVRQCGFRRGGDIGVLSLNVSLEEGLDALSDD